MFSFFIKVMVGRHRSSEGRICEPGSNGVTNSRNQSPITSHQSPLTNHLSPITSHQSPLTNHLSPLTNHLSPASPIPPLSLPSVRLSHGNHCTKNRVPGLLLQHHLIWEHTAVPTDMLESLSQFSLIVAKPISCIPGNVQFLIWIVGKT